MTEPLRGALLAALVLPDVDSPRQPHDVAICWPVASEGPGSDGPILAPRPGFYSSHSHLVCRVLLSGRRFTDTPPGQLIETAFLDITVEMVKALSQNAARTVEYGWAQGAESASWVIEPSLMDHGTLSSRRPHRPSRECGGSDVSLSFDEAAHSKRQGSFRFFAGQAKRPRTPALKSQRRCAARRFEGETIGV